MEYKDKKYTYLGGLVHGISTLATGMKTSIKVYFRKKVTEQYPENRKELKMFDRFRGTLNMPHNENNEHRCVACGLCQMACPNDTIKVTSETIETEDGKKKKILATYEYDLGTCMFCQLCVNACPHDAITFDQNFEHAVFDRSKLVLKLNHDGSKVIEKKKEVFTLRVSGESMINVGIYDGDILIVERKNTAINGETVVAMNNENEVTVKTFYKEKDHFRLQPENDTMDPIILKEVTILGKVIGLYRKL